jgi:hypothetical protein
MSVVPAGYTVMGPAAMVARAEGARAATRSALERNIEKAHGKK